MCKLLLYTDDAKLFFVVKKPYDSTLLHMQQEISKCLVWARSNRLRVNESKCNFLSFARGSLALRTTYHIDSKVLERVDYTRDLGVVFDSTMSFDN